MAWWINITPEVVQGIESFGFSYPPPDKILEFVEHYLSQYGEGCAANRWSKCPDDFFIYTHILIQGGRFDTLERLSHSCLQSRAFWRSSSACGASSLPQPQGTADFPRICDY